MDNRTVSAMATIVAMSADIEAMRAVNEHQKYIGGPPLYVEHDFRRVQYRAEELAERTKRP